MHRLKSIAIILACSLLIIGGCKGGPAAEGESRPELPVVEVGVVAVQDQEIKSRNEVNGTVEAVRRATIAAKVTGTIDELPVELGSLVKKGDILVKISAGEIDARVAQAAAQLKQAQRNFDREKRLLVKQASTPETVKSMEDSLKVAEAAHGEALTMLGYTTIKAPFPGVIAGKSAQAGDLATPGMPLLILENNRKLQVVASVPEALASRIRIGDCVPVINPVARVEKTGVVSEIAPSSDPRSRTTTIKLQLDDLAGLRAGQYVKLMLPGAAAKTLTVPEGAVSVYGQMERVFVAEDGHARLRLVRTGEHFDGMVEILAGLDSGEQVIIRNNNRTADGQPIEVVE